MKKLIIPFLALFVILILYGLFVNPNGQILVENTININGLPESYDGFKIIQISDILLGSTKSTEDLKEIVTEINDIKPDIVVFTGDLVSNGYNLNDEEIESLKESLKEINVNLYKYAVMGNNDEDNIELFQSVMKDADFIILDNESNYIFYKDNTPIKITGITNLDNIDKALDMVDNLDNCLNLVITHYPDFIDTLSNYDIDIVIAGGSLKGQIRIPFWGGILKQEGAKKYLDDYYVVGDTKMYVSGGLGTETIQFRLFNKPEINLYRLKQN